MKTVILVVMALVITGCAEIAPTIVTEFKTESLVCGVVECEFSDQPAIHCVKR